MTKTRCVWIQIPRFISSTLCVRTLFVYILLFGRSSSLAVRGEISVACAGKTASSLPWRSFVDILLRRNATVIQSRSDYLHVVPLYFPESLLRGVRHLLPVFVEPQCPVFPPLRNFPPANKFQLVPHTRKCETTAIHSTLLDLPRNRILSNLISFL